MANPLRTDVRSFTFDQLAWMADDDLVALMVNLEKDREGALSRNRVTRGVEVEICYVQRELDMRTSRQAAHAAWLASTGSEDIDAKISN